MTDEAHDGVVVFEPQSGGRERVLLGKLPIGEIGPVHDPRSHFPIYWNLTLPWAMSMHRLVPAESVEAARSEILERSTTGCSSPTCGRTGDAMTTDRTNVMSADEAFSRLPPEMPTTYVRMLEAARAQASRIEHSQAARIVGGDLKEPWPCQMRLRDDFFGIVRLIQLVTSDPVILDRLSPPKKGAGK